MDDKHLVNSALGAWFSLSVAAVAFFLSFELYLIFPILPVLLLVSAGLFIILRYKNELSRLHLLWSSAFVFQVGLFLKRDIDYTINIPLAGLSFILVVVSCFVGMPVQRRENK